MYFSYYHFREYLDGSIEIIDDARRFHITSTGSRSAAALAKWKAAHGG